MSSIIIKLLYQVHRYLFDGSEIIFCYNRPVRHYLSIGLLLIYRLFLYSFRNQSETVREPKMFGTSSELSIASRSSMTSWISDARLMEEIHKKRRRVCKRLRKTCTRHLLYRRLPFLSWIPKYDFSKFLSDANAGMAVSLTAIPQTIGYAAVAGLPAQVIHLPSNFMSSTTVLFPLHQSYFNDGYIKCTTTKIFLSLLIQVGLYSAFLGPLMYIFFGTVKEISVGPNSVIALMINSYVSEGGVAYAVILAFLTGIIQLIIGLLNLGTIHYFSR